MFAVLIVAGLAAGAPGSYDGKLLPILRKANASTLVVWGLWWPGLVLATILFGRVWCTVCPMELVTNIARRVASFAGLRGLALSPWLRAGFAVLVLYAALQVLVAGFQIHRIPYYTAFVLLALLALALAVGFLFREPRAFCHGFCPAALLLNVYSRITPIALRAASAATCRGCGTRDCVEPKNRFRLDARSCPSLLKPYDLKAEDACVLCFQCAKVCPHGNVGFGVLRPDAGRLGGATLATVLFIFMASGFVSHDLFAEVSAVDRLFHAVPQWLTALTGWAGGFVWFEAAWYLLMLPAIVCGVAGLAALVFGARGTLLEIAEKIALSLVPVLAAGHAMKALLKMNTWAGFLPGAFRDPVGLATAGATAAGSVTAPLPLLPPNVVALLVTILLAGSVFLAFRTIQRHIDQTLRKAAYAGAGLLASLYTIVAIALLIK